MDEPDRQPEPAAARPLILFDGVCNLCNAAVQWVLERDRDGQFDFASLQSDAARHAVEAAGDDPDALPDSIVLVDDDGTHVRSAAAIRIARRLGGVYSLLGVGLVSPRFVRDAIYAFIARNRYRWFGRRDTCMLPDPAVAARFLDAGEDRPVIPLEEPEPSGQPATSWLGAWGSRFAITYVLVYMAPFPLTLLFYLTRLPVIGWIPGLSTALGWVIGAHAAITQPLAQWVGGLMFGRELSPAFTGSGDTSFNYADLVLDLGIALLIATVWTLWTRRQRISATTVDVSRTLARYYLATTMLVYGWIKFFPLQFPTPTPDRLIQPYGDSSPMGLAWTFLGASVGYQIFAGFAELLGGYLLLWRRTTLLGAVVSALVMSNVVAINVFYDVPVKLFSSHLVLVALFIAAPELPRLAGVFVFNLPVAAQTQAPFWRRFARGTAWVAAAHLVFVGVLTYFHVSDNLASQYERGIWREPSPYEAIYVVEEFTQGGLSDRGLPDEARWVRVGITPPYMIATIQRANGVAVRMRMALDSDAGTVSFYDRGGQPPDEPQFTVAWMDDETLRLEGLFEDQSTVVVMRKQDVDPLLSSRGFRWINEFPFNR